MAIRTRALRTSANDAEEKAEPPPRALSARRSLSRRDWSAATVATAPVLAWLVSAPDRALAEGEPSDEGAGEPMARAPAAAAATMEEKPFPEFEVPYKRKPVPWSKFRGKAMIVCNVKNDDPEALKQYPALAYLNKKYYTDGLRILAFPTDQGWYEPEVSEIVRQRALQAFGFGQFPYAVVFDKVDILGSTSHPLYNYLMRALPNPNGKSSVTLNFEKFLVDGSGKPVRRYPRKYSGFQMERDVEALLAGEPLPEESDAFLTAWKDAEREAIKSEYSFRSGYNVYKQANPSIDWQGTADEGFR